MAREAELNVGPAGMGQTVWGSDTNLKRFEALVRADEREACLANVKKVFATFDVLPESAEKKMLKSMTLIFIESIKEEIELRVKS
jgi:hypothetical protein